MSSLGAGEAGDWGRISKSFSHNLWGILAQLDEPQFIRKRGPVLLRLAKRTAETERGGHLRTAVGEEQLHCWRNSPHGRWRLDFSISAPLIVLRGDSSCRRALLCLAECWVASGASITRGQQPRLPQFWQPETSADIAKCLLGGQNCPWVRMTSADGSTGSFPQPMPARGQQSQQQRSPEATHWQIVGGRADTRVNHQRYHVPAKSQDRDWGPRQAQMRDRLNNQTWDEEAHSVVDIVYLVTEIGESEDLKNVLLIFKDKASQPL